MHPRQCRGTHIHGLATGTYAQAAILRQPALGDVHAGDQLQARSDGIETFARQLQPGIQHAIDAEADDELVFVGFEMDVGGPLLHRLCHQAVDQLDHRRLLGQFTQVADVIATVPRSQQATPELVQGAFHQLGRGQHPLHILRRVQISQRFLQHRIQRITAGTPEATLGVLPDQHPLVLHPVHRYRLLAGNDPCLDLGQDHVAPCQRKAQLVGQRGQQLLL